MSLYDRIRFKMISVYFGTLYGLFLDPYPLLNAAGLKLGQRTLEIGCGPGFFTIPAARIVGNEGHVCALDINIVAVESVRRKIAQAGLENAEVILADAGETGLRDQSYDVTFLFGVINALSDLDKVITEMHRVLVTGGILSVQKFGRSEEKLLNTITKNGLFSLEEKTGRIYRFQKS